MLRASSAAEEEEEESELADLPCLDKGLGVFFFFFSFLSLLALELLGILTTHACLLGVYPPEVPSSARCSIELGIPSCQKGV